MEDYLNMLDRLDKADSNDIFNNTSTDHAKCLVRKLFQRGRSKVVLFTGSLNPDIYGDESVVKDIGLFLNARGGKLDVIVQNSKAEKAKLLSEGLLGSLISSYGETALNGVRVRRGGEMVKKFQSHFMVVDGKGFRFEPDNTKHEALASLNRPEVGKTLDATFDQMWNDANHAEKIFN